MSDTLRPPGLKKKPKSHFPNALRVLSELESSKDRTISSTPRPELLDACRHRGVICRICGTFDELGIDWHHVLVMNNEGDVNHQEWYCRICFKDETKSPPYLYNSNNLDKAVDEPFKKLPKLTKQDRT